MYKLNSGMGTQKISLPLKAAATYTRTKIVNPKEVAMASTLVSSSRQSVGVAASSHKPVSGEARQNSSVQSWTRATG